MAHQPEQQTGKSRGLSIAGLSVSLLALGGASFAFAQSSAPPELKPGAAAYAANCAACHGTNLEGGQFSALKGDAFLQNWGGANASALLEFVQSAMPPSNVGGLDEATYASIVQHIFEQNGVPETFDFAAANKEQLSTVSLPKASGRFEVDVQFGIGGQSEAYPGPPPPVRVDRFANYSPVTDAMLDNPAPENWLTWRRSHKGLGYSPLTQIDRKNVSNLHVAWALPLPAGEMTNEPLVRDGVLYLFGYNDTILALDAVDGKILWAYQRELPQGTTISGKKAMALYSDKLFAATSDLRMIALDARTGKLAWETQITDNKGFRNPGGPLVAEGVVMQGLTSQTAGGSFIAGFDAETGERLWTFNTVAQPDEPGGDSWNGLAAEDRSGGSSWTSGTYDAETGVALWGTGPTYDTGPLRDAKPGMNNDALYTDTTLAIEPRTGKLRWYFQHMKNDQWDLDWTFDRVIGTLDVAGERRRVIMTSGKEGLFDTLDAETGKYVKTVDLGVQNFVTAIDPLTGDKTIDPAKVPDRKTSMLVCPNGGGGRNWSATSYNESSQRLFAVARDVCMEMRPARNGGFLSTGVDILYAAPPGSDGNYGVLKALDMKAGKIAWEVRQRATFNTGVLTTATGLLFVGSVDRQVKAFDQKDGSLLWQSGLSGIPNAAPITYSVDGKQYVAFVTGHGNPLSFGIGAMTPDVTPPPIQSSAIYVFALPD